MTGARRRVLHADRDGLQGWLLWATVAATALCCGVAGSVAATRETRSPSVGVLVGVAVAALAVVGLRSISVRLVARSMLVASAGVLIRFGVLGGSVASGSQAILAWVVGAVTVLVLTDRIGTDGQAALGAPGPGGVPQPGSSSVGGHGAGPGRAEGVRTARAAVCSALAVVVVVLVVTPIALPRLARSTSPGEGPRLSSDAEGSTVLRATDSLDMTSRPDLTDEIVFRVTTDRATFWRGETFDAWDGRRWTRTDPGRSAVRVDGSVVAGPDDLGTVGPDRFVQRFRVETTFSDVVYGAPSAVRVDAGRALAQRDDGTVTTAGVALGRGATYEVESRRPPLSEELLRRAGRGPVPADIRERYASDPVITDRVREAATTVTADADNTYDKVKALERWMGDRTEYSLDAPLSPEGVDVVDHFLFDSKQGWCEQVASSLVVMARANKIPARLVTGFVPDERDPVTGTYVVRARDAHAWAEVWFPDVGWVPFDPTANVPLASSDQTTPSLGQWLIDHALILGLSLAAIALLAWPVVTLGRRWRRRFVARPRTWAARADARLVELGERVDRPRTDDETATTYAHALAERYHDGRLVGVGEAIDDSLFAADPPRADLEAATDRVLDEIAAADPPDRQPVA